MLRICTEQEYEKYAGFVYELALDQTKSGYPTYCDGIKTKEMFMERARKAFLSDTECILLFEYEGVVEGWIHYYYFPEDNYLSTESFNINLHTEQALQEFLELVQEKFKGYELFLGYPKQNKKAIAFLLAHGFECIEEDYNNSVFLSEYEPIRISDKVVSITRDNYQYFRALHSNLEGDMYWNSDRIYSDIDNWIIFAKIKDNEADGCVYFMTADDGWFEIFGIDFKDNVFDPVLFRELLGKALNVAKELGGKYMTFFCDEEGEETVMKLGFKCVGGYVCYKKILM